MARTAHIIGNGDRAGMFKQPQKGIKITCNLPPFSVEGAYATCLVDFKIMHAMHTQHNKYTILCGVAKQRK